MLFQAAQKHDATATSIVVSAPCYAQFSWWGQQEHEAEHAQAISIKIRVQNVSLAFHNIPSIKWKLSGFLRASSRVLLQQLKYIIIQTLAHNTLDPEQTEVCRRDDPKGRGWKFLFFSLSSSQSLWWYADFVQQQTTKGAGTWEKVHGEKKHNLLYLKRFFFVCLLMGSLALDQWKTIGFHM